MPGKIQVDEALQFLYICIMKSDLKAIDFQAVAQATNLKSPAARMRYTRLKKQIESGQMFGSGGFPLGGPTVGECARVVEVEDVGEKSSTGRSTKRKRGGRENTKMERSVKDEHAFEDEEEDRKRDIKIVAKLEEVKQKFDSESNIIGSPQTRTPAASSPPTIKNEPGRENENELIVIKEEPQDYSDFESGTGSEYEEDSEDSEDEMPIAKLRKVAVGEVRERERVGEFGVLKERVFEGRKGGYQSPYSRVVSPISSIAVPSVSVTKAPRTEVEVGGGKEMEGGEGEGMTSSLLPPSPPPANKGNGNEEVAVVALKPTDSSVPNHVAIEGGQGEKQKRPFEGWSDDMKFGSWSKKRKGDDGAEVLSTAFAGGIKMERS